MRGLTKWNVYRHWSDLNAAAKSLERDIPGLETFYSTEIAGPWVLWFIIPTPKGNGHKPDVVPPGPDETDVPVFKG